MIFPYLQYCNLIWSSTYPTNLSRLVLLQKRAVRIINKSDFLAHTSPIFKELHLLKLQDIRILQICQFMFSCESKKLPYKFQEMFILNSQVHNYNTRSKHFDFISLLLEQIIVNFLSDIKAQLYLIHSCSNEIKQNASYHIFTKKPKAQLISSY